MSIYNSAGKVKQLVGIKGLNPIVKDELRLEFYKGVYDALLWERQKREGDAIVVKRAQEFDAKITQILNNLQPQQATQPLDVPKPEVQQEPKAPNQVAKKGVKTKVVPQGKETETKTESIYEPEVH
jgi:hypothetical protein